MAATPAKMPKARKYGIPSSQRPTVVRTARRTMATSCPTIQARKVIFRSRRTLRASSRRGGGTRAITPSVYTRGWRARYTAITRTLIPSIRKVTPPVR
jgi:hypothetical protein